MTVLAAVAPDGRGISGVHLAGRIAATTGEAVMLTCVVPDSWETRALPRGIDKDWRRHLETLASRSLQEAVQILPPGVVAETAVHVARSVPRALIAQAKQMHATTLCIGSSDDALMGHVALGSAGNRLVHSSAVPIAVAPRAFWSAPEDRVERIVLAVGADADEGAVDTAVAVAARVRAALVLVTFGVRRLPASADTVGRQADHEVFEVWRERVAAVQEAAAARAGELGVEVTERTVAVAESWGRAVAKLHWNEGDLMVLGSSREGVLARVFLGSTAQRILSKSPVPVVVLPRR